MYVEIILILLTNIIESKPNTAHELLPTAREDTPTAEELLLDGMIIFVPDGGRTNIYGGRTVSTAGEPTPTATRLNQQSTLLTKLET